MKIIDYNVSCSEEYSIDGYLSHYYNKEKLLFFDIETTGFIAKNSTLYLIGVLWYENGNLQLRQWFNDDGQCETELIESFTAFSRNFTHLIHFNGIGFDLPYLRQKAELLSLSFNLEHTMSQIDIYKEIRAYKSIFALDNMKQVSIERFLNLQREDTYNGKELINIYQRYVAKPNDEAEHLLLLHNHDDLLGMTNISHILHYKNLFEQVEIFEINIDSTDGQLIIHFSFNPEIPLPRRITATRNGIYLNAIDCKGTLYIPICNDTLKHYFEDYKNYYYLPLEDMAVHKSIATYVESQNKVKATKSTCYIKKADTFIVCSPNDTTLTFKKEYNDKVCFCPLESFINTDFKTQCSYIKNTLLTFL
ncbi:MAG: ribonuclease H-like domain-containing protein [Lachnospiraceae bacterium]|nr:ribonuclease H-like domain-containing protein [Lachnospiraceae bacterium]